MATDTGIAPVKKVTAPPTALVSVLMNATRSVSGFTAATTESSPVMAMADDRLGRFSTGPAGGGGGGQAVSSRHSAVAAAASSVGRFDMGEKSLLSGGRRG